MTFMMSHQNGISIHLRLNNIAALSYLLKFEGIKSRDMTSVTKEIWDYHLSWKNCHYGRIFHKGDEFGSRLGISNLKSTSEWKLCTEVFKIICQARETPNIDLFASRISHQLPQYVSWKVDSFSSGQDTFLINWCWTFTYGPPSALLGRVLWNVQQDQHQALRIIITLLWQTQAWFPGLLQMSFKNPLLFPQK